MRMTDVRMGNLRMILEKMARIKPGTNLVVFSDDYVRATSLAWDFMDLANSMGSNAVMTVFKKRTHLSEEPPPPIAAAMKAADVILGVMEGPEIAHSTARKEATDGGAQRCVMVDPLDGEDYLQKPITVEDLDIIHKRSAELCDIEAKGKKVRLTTPHGTDLTFSIEGRTPISLDPLSDSPLIVAPFYAEVAIAPVEGTTEGIVVVDSFVQQWEYMLRKPFHFEVKNGRAQVETVTSDISADAERFKQTISMDELANNCAAEFGIGTSHTIPGNPIGHVTDKARIGHVHIACGRNYDLGGTSDSIIHQDVDMTRATIIIDDVAIMENGEFKI